MAVGLSEPEAKAIVAPYNYGIPGYYGGVAAPFAYNNAWTAPLNYAPQTAYPYAPQTAYSYAPYAQAYAPVAAPAPVAPVNYAAFAPAPLSSQFAAGVSFKYLLLLANRVCKNPKISKTLPKPENWGISGFGSDNPNSNMSQT